MVSDATEGRRLSRAVFAALRRERVAPALAAWLPRLGYSTTVSRPGGRVLATDPRGHTTRFDPDAQGLVGAVISPLGRRWQLDNDAHGRPTGITDPAGTRLGLAWDARGRLTQCARAGGLGWQFEYDGADNLIGVRWPDGAREGMEYRDYRLLVAATDRSGGRETFDYDAAERLTALTDANGATTCVEYGSAARPSALQFADGRRETYHWAPSSTDAKVLELTALGDAADIHTRIGYVGGDLAALDYGDGERIRFRRDAAGRLIEAAADGAWLRFTYDGSGRVTTEESAEGRIEYRYDEAGNLIGIAAPTGAVGYDWNADLELSGIRTWDGSTARFLYSPDGRTCDTHYGDHLRSRSQRTAGGQLGEVEVTGAGRRVYAARYIKSQGLKTEKRFGDRYADAANGEIHQIGGLNQRGDPIARERDAIDDILNSSEYRDNPRPVVFHDKSNPAAQPIEIPVKDGKADWDVLRR